MRNGFITLAPLAAAFIFAAPLPSTAAPESAPNAPTKGATCTSDHIDATPAMLVQPDMPAAAVADGVTSGTVMVRVDLSPQGKLDKSTVMASSGNFYLDHEALATVRQMAFTPEKLNCLPVGSSYAIRVRFQS